MHLSLGDVSLISRKVEGPAIGRRRVGRGDKNKNKGGAGALGLQTVPRTARALNHPANPLQTTLILRNQCATFYQYDTGTVYGQILINKPVVCYGGI